MPDSRATLHDATRYLRGGALDQALTGFGAVVADETAAAELRAEALRGIAEVYRLRSEWDAALEAAAASCEVAGAAGLDIAYAEGLNAQAIVYQMIGRFDAARPLLEAVLEGTADPRVRGIAYQNLGYVAASQGDFERAEAQFEASVYCFENAGYERGVAIALINRSQALLDRGEAAQAEAVGADAIRTARRVNDLDLVASAAMNLAAAVARRGDLDRAADLVSEALGQLLTIGNRIKQVEALKRLGDLQRQRGDLVVAERCYRQGLDLARRIDARLEAEALEAVLADLSGPDGDG